MFLFQGGLLSTAEQTLKVMVEIIQGQGKIRIDQT